LHRYRNRYAVAGLLMATAYVALILALNYLISSQTPARMLSEYPAAAILSYLIIPLSFLVGYLWGAERDQRASVKVLSQRQQEHVEMAESLSNLLRQSEETRRMTAIAMQEMKHPLTSIIGYALTLREYWDRLDEPSRREFVEFISVSASRLEGIANDMVRIAELGRLSPRVEKEAVNLKEILEEVRHILEEIHAEREVKVGLRYPDDLPAMIGDPSRLFDLFYNLLDICMRFSEGKKIVSAWCSVKDRAVQVRLRCPASCIKTEKLKRLKDWPPPEGDDELATTGMEYRLSQLLAKELGANLKMDVVGERGLSFFVSLPLQS